MTTVCHAALFSVFFLGAAPALADQPTPGRQIAQSVELKTGEGEAKRSLHFLLFLPNDCRLDNNTRKWSVLLFLHGVGDGADLDRIKRNGPPKIVENRPNFPMITVSPQCVPDDGYEPAELNQLLDFVIKSLPVDERRIYLTGISRGGAAVWDWAAAFPERFAAIVPICGYADPRTAPKIKNIPTWVFHGARDSVVPIAQSERMVEALRRAGGSPKFTAYRTADHDAWTAAYNDPKLYAWLLEQARAPKKIVKREP